MFRFKARNSQWNQPFQKGILSISDQQIVTGIAILLAGFVQINSISAFHWYIVVYLGWMSSNVHLTTLAVLRGHMQTNRPVRAIRVIGMTILFALLLCALIPTTSKDFTNSLDDDPCKPEEFTPVTDLWKAEHLQDMDSLRIISIILLIISYIWKVGALFKDSSHFAATWFQEKPGTFLKNIIRRMNSHRRAMKRKRPFIYKLTLWSYSQLMGLYAVSLVIYDLLTSFVASIWILCVVLAWGTVNLLAIRHSYRFDEEREWTFGQLVPVLMLILPVMSISQEFFGS
ncbi:uncharacterized protein LTHEOB_3169 [Lasiodiplodia theobromae]|uniref:uncharacterized protein n=1 Tax=Lasiodiplodia theobromae TaxID=45133 RepID=UPI0015C316E7|nr:uncharacterized protein LTHEOB_3169 [Lasiodiplodia theobromae]KAF4534361.1 hypothetical protein LTHEOB_3169 [Lasiodiplodia theobromae]